jgi:hypothetical protein
VLGVVSEGDILLKERGPMERGGRLLLRRHRAERATAERKARAITVQDAMSAPAITISSYSSVADAARLMSEYGINRLPVIKDGELVGIVTRTDLVRAFVRSDEDIRREIKQDLLRRTLWLEVSEASRVEVERGAVRLEGRLQRRSDGALLERLVARVPGVVSVQGALSWTTDDIGRKGEAACAERVRP